MEKIYQLEGAKPIIAQAQEAGPIDVVFAENFDVKSKALWDSRNRTIVINAKYGVDTVQLIQTVLFELHNAAAAPQVNALATDAMNGHIQKNDFIEAMERIEYQNAIQTGKLLEEGIAKGLFPATARKPVAASFAEYKAGSGRSDLFACKFDLLKQQFKLPS